MKKNIIFDIGDVLVSFRPKEAMADIGIPKAHIPALFDATVGSRWWAELDRGVLTEDACFVHMKEEHPELAAEIDLFHPAAKPLLVVSYDYAADWLSSLKASGYHIYLLSNYPESYYRLHCTKDFNFLPYVDGEVISAFVRMAKPDSAIYRHLLDKYHLKAEECVFLDDKPANIEAAEALGIQSILFTGYANAREQLSQFLNQ